MTAAVAYRSNATNPRRRTSARPSAKRSGRPQLRVLDQVAVRRRARRRHVAILLFMVLLSGLFVVAFVHAQLVATQQDLDETRAEITELRNERARLERAVDEASSPALIVERAAELGMVRAAQPVFLISVAPIDGDGTDAPVQAVASTPLVGSERTTETPIESPSTVAPADDVRPETALGGIGDG